MARFVKELGDYRVANPNGKKHYPTNWQRLKKLNHEITRVELSVEWDAPFKDVTDQFMKGRIEV